MFKVVPNYVRDEINIKLDKAIADFPEAEKDREYLSQQLLAYFDEHGTIPEFSLKKVKIND